MSRVISEIRDSPDFRRLSMDRIGAGAHPTGLNSRMRRVCTNFYRRFPGDYLRDTQHLTAFQHGVYNLLLDTLYATEKPIASMQHAFQIARCHSGSARKSCVSVVLEMFISNDDGSIWHKRVQEEINYAESRRLKASAGGKAKQEKYATSTHQAVPVLDFRHQTLENSKSKAIAQNSGLSELVGFALFWTAYPKKVGKPLARKAWLSKVKDDSRYAEVIAGLEMWKACEQWQDQQFIPYPATFLNQMRWQDEVPRGGSNGKSKSEQRSERVRDACQRVFGTTGAVGRALRGELRQGTDNRDVPSLQDGIVRPPAKIPS